MPETNRFPPKPVGDEEMTTELAYLDRLQTRVVALQNLLAAGRVNESRLMLSGGPCEREFDLNYRGYLRHALTNGMARREIERLEDGMDRAFTELAAGSDFVRARECLDRKRDPSIPLLRRPVLSDDPRSFAPEASSPSP